MWPSPKCIAADYSCSGARVIPFGHDYLGMISSGYMFVEFVSTQQYEERLGLLQHK
jgi:hypothetical protein